MSSQTIGTCSLCGGRVSVPDVWMGINPPIPQCDSCHAMASNHGPVIPMKPVQMNPLHPYNPFAKPSSPKG